MSLKTSLQIVVSVRRFEDILKTSWRRLEDVWPRRIYSSWSLVEKYDEANIFVIQKIKTIKLNTLQYYMNISAVVWKMFVYSARFSVETGWGCIFYLEQLPWMTIYTVIPLNLFGGQLSLSVFTGDLFVCLFLLRFHYTLWVVRLHCCCGPVHQQVFPKKTEKIPEVNFRYFLL